MRRFLSAGLAVKLFVPLVLLLLLGISARVRVSPKVESQVRAAVESLGSESAAFELPQVAGVSPWRATPWQVAGREALMNGDAQAAIRYLSVARALQPLSAEALVDLGDAYQQTGDFAAAEAAWSDALAQGAPSADLVKRLAGLHQASGDYMAELADLQMLTRLSPANPEVQYRLGMLLAIFQPEDALAHLTQAGDLNPGLTRNADEIVGAIRKARLLSEEEAYLSLSTGRALASLGEWNLARLAFDLATQQRPDYAEAWAYLGEAQYHLGEDSELALQTAQGLDSSSPAVSLLSALYWQRQGDFDQARRFLESAASQEPDNTALLLELAETASALGEIELAMAYYQRMIELDPESPRNWQHLAAYSIHNDIQVREIGLPAARQAVLLDENDPVGLDLVGQAYSILGDNATAHRFLNSSIQADPDYAPAYLHLGMLYLAEGDRQAARFHLERAATLAVDTPLAEQTRRVLETYFP